VLFVTFDVWVTLVHPISLCLSYYPEIKYICCGVFVSRCCVVLCCVMSCHVVVLCHVVLCVILCHVVLCHAVPCRVVLCVVLCCVVLCRSESLRAGEFEASLHAQEVPGRILVHLPGKHQTLHCLLLLHLLPLVTCMMT
jgi:hypothetical protein